MALKESIKPITYMKTNAADILAKVSRSRRPMIITHNGEGKMVIQDIESYQALRETLTLLKIAALGRLAAERGDMKTATDAFISVEQKRKRHA